MMILLDIIRIFTRSKKTKHWKIKDTVTEKNGQILLVME